MLTPLTLKSRREALGLSRREMAFHLEVRPSTYIGWETGTPIPSTIEDHIQELTEAAASLTRTRRQMIQHKRAATGSSHVTIEVPTTDADAAIMVMPDRWPAALIRAATARAANEEWEENGTTATLIPFRL